VIARHFVAKVIIEIIDNRDSPLMAGDSARKMVLRRITLIIQMGD